MLKEARVNVVHEWKNKLEVLVRLVPILSPVVASFLIDHIGNFVYHSSVQLLRFPDFAAVFPQVFIPGNSVKELRQDLARTLYSKGVFRYINLKTSTEGIMNFEVGVIPYSTVLFIFQQFNERSI